MSQIKNLDSNLADCIKTLKAALPPAAYCEDSALIAPHLREWRDKFFGQTPLLLLPANTDDVSQIVKICATYNIALMPQGGNTGLVGGNTPQGEILISLKRMRAIRRACPDDNVLIAEAGVTLLEAQQTAEKIGRKFPLSLASEGSCTIGGNLSTNAGGVHVIKYGTAKDLCLGVEAVLPNGDIHRGLSALKKDNTGYDLSRLFLGAEGTLGIITAASLKLFPKPNATQRAMAGLNTVKDALALLNMAQNPALTLFEIIPRIGLDLVTTYIPEMRDPFATPYDWYVLIDWEFYGKDTGEQTVQNVLIQATEAGLIEDAILAQSESQAANLLALRENLSAAQKFNGGSIKHDISVPVACLPEFFERANKASQKCVPGCRPVGFGHLGDGNIHYNVAQPEDMDKEAFMAHWDQLTSLINDIVCELGGSISAEHGIGILKKDELARRADPVKLGLMRNIKQILDPKNIMNPRVMFDIDPK